MKPALSKWRLRLGAVAAAGMSGAVLVTITAPGWTQPVPVGRVEMPGLRGDIVRQGAFWAGMVLLALGWLGLVYLSRTMPGGSRLRLAVVCAIAGLWAVPLLAGPPLQSRDAYSYAAQAEMASRGIDPSVTGPSALADADARFTQRVSRNWTDAPAPYGPVSGGIGATIAELAGHDPDGILTATKLVALAALLCTACLLPTVARAHGVAPELAVALGLANPVVALHLVGGAHNDAVVAALVVAAFWARARGWRAAAVGLAAMAMAVKLPAVAAVFYLGWFWAEPARSGTPVRRGRGNPAEDHGLRWRRLGTGAAAVAVAACIHMALSAVTGTGWGVVSALAESTHVTTDLSLPQVMAMLVSADPDSALLDRMRAVCMAAAVGLSLLVWFRSERLGALRAAGLTMVVLALFGPVLHPWYPAVGLILLAAAPMGRWRPAYMTGVVVLAFSLRAGGGGIFADAGVWRPALAAGTWGLVLFVAAVTAVWNGRPARRRLATS